MDITQQSIKEEDGTFLAFLGHTTIQTEDEHEWKHNNQTQGRIRMSDDATAKTRTNTNTTITNTNTTIKNTNRTIKHEDTAEGEE